MIVEETGLDPFDPRYVVGQIARLQQGYSTIVEKLSLAAEHGRAMRAIVVGALEAEVQHNRLPQGRSGEYAEGFRASLREIAERIGIAGWPTRAMAGWRGRVFSSSPGPGTGRRCR